MIDAAVQPLLRKRRRFRRAIFPAVFILIIVLGSPFLFASTIVRWCLARSDYAAFRPTIGSATLSPSGGLTLYDVTFHEPNSDTVLLHADRVDATFSWHKVFAREIQSIRVSGLTVHVRATPDRPVSLLRLAEAAPSAGVTSDTASGENQLWIGSVLATGQCIIDPNVALQPAAATLPLTIYMHTEGSHTSPEPRVDVRLGAAADSTMDSPWLLGQLCYVRGRFITFALDGQSVDLHATSPALLEPLRAYLPVAANASQVSIDRLHLDGKITSGADQPRVSGTLRILDLSAAAMHAGAPVAAVDRVTYTATFDVPLNASSTRDMRLDAASFRIASVTFGPDTAHALAGTVGVQDGAVSGALSFSSLAHDGTNLGPTAADFLFQDNLLALSALDLQYAGGSVKGSLKFDTAGAKIRAAQLELAHIDAHQALAAAAPGRIDAQGSLTGTAKFFLDDQGELKGRLDLTADAAGKLLISDDQIANALAKPLTQSNIPNTPPNFSDIVVAQLKNYPWKNAHVQAYTVKGTPVLRLDLTREPLKEGEPGYGVDVNIGGQTVKASYPVQIALEIALPNQTIESILATATGLKSLLVPPAAASQPAPR